MCNIAMNIVQMQYCTVYCSSAKLRWILFKCNTWQCNVAQHADPGEGRWNCGGLQGHSFQWRWATTSGQLSMQLCILKIIDAIMHFKNHWCNNVFQKLSIISHAFQILWMKLCISTIINAIMHFNNGALVGGVQLADCNSRAPRAINDDFFLQFQKSVAGHIFPSAERMIYLIYQPEVFTWFTGQSFILGRRLSYHHFIVRFTAPEKEK